MSATLRVVMAQLNLLVGDIEGNTQRVIDAANKAKSEHSADAIVFPELTLTAYPPEDLLLRDSLEVRITKAIDRLLAEVDGISLVVGYPRRKEAGLFNMAGVIRDGEIVVEYAKQKLPNYQVFDEKRYFVAGNEPVVFPLNGVPVALSICEDLWHKEPIAKAASAGAKLVFNLNASPFHVDKLSERQDLLCQRVTETGMPILYVNQVGGQDELIFDGGSMAADVCGSVKYSAPCFEEGLFLVEFTFDGNNCRLASEREEPVLSLEALVYQALVTGVRDYVNKNGFKGVVLGLSGGIDSALTLAVAVDALGKDRVHAVMMPFRYTSTMSIEDAAEEAALLGVGYEVVSIESIYESFMGALDPLFVGTKKDTTEENLQARCRGVLLMALSNKKGYMVLTTGNKSEMAVGYATLYGDMVGGYSALKDVFKTLVFRLSNYRNSLGYVIPQRVIDRPPSAELAPDQVDEDSLPSYDILDQILAHYIEDDLSADQIIAQGFESETVNRVVRLVDVNEYKRRQAPVGVRITQRGFGRDRRYPITNGWKLGE